MSVAKELRTTIRESTPKLLSISDETASWKPGPDVWSPKEIIGHLIDSASNNHVRFVKAQFVDDLVFDGYEQDRWVTAQSYNQRLWRELVECWKTLNKNLANVMEAVPAAAATMPRARHNLDEIAWKPVPRTEPATLEYFMMDYVGHLRHHIKQVHERVKIRP
jgi:hypothetical protein